MIVKIILRSSIIIILALFSCSGSKINDNINGGFESSHTGDNPDGWFPNSLLRTTKYAELSVDNTAAHTGNKSILISVSNHHPKAVTVYNWVSMVDELREGKIYELQGWVKTEKVKSSPFIEVQFWNSSQIIGTASTAQGYLITGTKNWQLVNTIFSVPHGTSKVLIRAGISSYKNNGGKAWFDDIQIQNVK